MAEVIRRIAWSFEARSEPIPAHLRGVPAEGEVGINAFSPHVGPRLHDNFSSRLEDDEVNPPNNAADDARRIVQAWRGRDDESIDASEISIVETFFKSFGSKHHNKAPVALQAGSKKTPMLSFFGGNAAINGTNRCEGDIPSDFIEAFALPIAKVVTRTTLHCARQILKRAEEGGRETANCGLASRRELLAVYANRVLPIAIPLLWSESSSIHATEIATAVVSTTSNTSGADPQLLLLLQPILVGVEAVAKGLAFHIDQIMQRRDSTHMARARSIFSIIEKQLASICAFAALFETSTSSNANSSLCSIVAKDIVIASYASTVDDLLRKSVIAVLAAEDRVGVGLLSLFDALVSFVQTFTANHNFVDSFTLVAGEKTKTAGRIALPGAGAVLACEDGGIVSRVVDAAIGRVMTLMAVDAGEDGRADETQNNTAASAPSSSRSADWREEHLSEAFHIPLPSPFLVKSGRVVASVHKTARVLLPFLASPSRYEAFINITEGFTAKALAVIGGGLKERLDACHDAEDDNTPLLKQLEQYLQAHKDLALASEWGLEWTELMEGQQGPESTQEALDAIHCDRDQCLRSIVEVFLHIVSDASDRCAEGESVGQVCHLFSRRLTKLYSLYGSSQMWKLAKAAADGKARKVLSRGAEEGGAGLDEADISQIICAVFGE